MLRGALDAMSLAAMALVRGSDPGHIALYAWGLVGVGLARPRKVFADLIWGGALVSPTVDDAELPLVATEGLVPFASLVLLRSTGPDHGLAVGSLANRMTQAARNVRSGRVEIVALGLSGADGYLRADGDAQGVDELWAFVYQVRREPSWSADASAYLSGRLCRRGCG